jgi:hypothetical protein
MCYLQPLERSLLKSRAKEEDMVQKVVALALLLVLPMVFTVLSGPASPAYAYVFTKTGMTAEEIALYGTATALICTLAFTGFAAVGCGLAAVG